MRSGLMQEIIAAAHEYESMERENEELRKKADVTEQEYSTCSICDDRIGRRYMLSPFMNRYRVTLYACDECKRRVFDAYNVFADSVNGEKGGE